MRMFKLRFYLLLAISVLVLLPTSVAQAEDIHWGYEGETGPAYWGVLSPDWALCGSGESQSPVDIPSTAPAHHADDLTQTYLPSALNIFNSGHNIQVNYDEGSTLVVDGETYNLLQFHFHAASEHTVDGSARPMEVHFVHGDEAGNLAVIGVFLEEGMESAAYAPIFDNLPAAEGEPEPVDGVTVNATDLMPATQTHWRYDGSLTTPPCSENVKWIVMNNSVDLSADQIGAFTAIYDNNARPTQPMNSREFLEQAPHEEPETLPETGGVVGGAQSVLVTIGVLLALAGAAAVSSVRRQTSA
jgi:carbonic anhydrase